MFAALSNNRTAPRFLFSLSLLRIHQRKKNPFTISKLNTTSTGVSLGRASRLLIPLRGRETQIETQLLLWAAKCDFRAKNPLLSYVSPAEAHHTPLTITYTAAPIPRTGTTRSGPRLPAAATLQPKRRAWRAHKNSSGWEFRFLNGLLGEKEQMNQESRDCRQVSESPCVESVRTNPGKGLRRFVFWNFTAWKPHICNIRGCAVSQIGRSRSCSVSVS